MEQEFGHVTRKTTAKDLLQQAMWSNQAQRKISNNSFTKQYDRISQPLRDFITKLKQDYGIND